MAKGTALSGLSSKLRDNRVIVDVPYDPKQSLSSSSSFKAMVQGRGTFAESLYSHQR